VLRQYKHFKIELSRDLISLPDKPALVAELRRFMHPGAG
jgi:hypothetical protein